MHVTIKFLGTLSTKFGNMPINIQIDPNYESLHANIRQFIGTDQRTSFVILRTGKTLNENSEPIKEHDEFLVLQPISGG